MDWIISAAKAATIAIGTLTIGPNGPSPSNTITLTDASGVGETNYPFQFGRPFLRGVISHAPQVLINGVPTTSQADVKNRYPDGSAEFAVMAVVIPAIPAKGSVTLSFQDTLTTSTPLLQSQMQAMLPVGAMAMTLTPGGTADAGQMLADGNCKLWTSGQIAQTIECADDSAARKYDLGIGDGFHPFRPRFYVTFWPGTGQVYVRVVGENGLTTEQEDIAYNLNITSNNITLYSKDLTGATKIGSAPLIHWVEGRWTKQFWLGGTPQQQVNIDNNLQYLTSTRFLPNMDPTVAYSPTAIASAYSSYISGSVDLYSSGAWPFAWVTSMGQAGDNMHIGPYPLITALWLHSGDWRMRYMALKQTDLAAAWPLGLRESDPTRIFQRGDAAGSGTGLGRAISLAGRPQMWNGVDNPKIVGSIVAPVLRPWNADTAHQPSVYFPTYVVTGDPWYLDMLYSWAGMSSPEAPFPPYICTTQIPNCAAYRGPTGAYGGLFGADSERDVGWTLRGRAETAFAAPDNTPEKSYFTYMTNDAIAKFEGGMGITGTPLDNATIKTWIRKTLCPYIWTIFTNTPISCQVPPLGGMALYGAGQYSDTIQTSWGLVPRAASAIDDPWMNFYLDYAVGRAVELGFAARSLQTQWGKLPINIINSASPWMLGSYVMPVAASNLVAWWSSVDALVGAAMDPTFVANLKKNWLSGGRGAWVQPGLAMLVDQQVPGAMAAWSWYNANKPATDARWAILPRTDHNILPPQPTTTPP